MTDQITTARNVLAKWRESAGPSAWDVFEMWGPDDQFVRVSNVTDHVTDSHRDFLGLIVGTAGNPALLDALDKELASAEQFPDAHNTTAKRIAAAIIAADNQMNGAGQ